MKLRGEKRAGAITLDMDRHAACDTRSGMIMVELSFCIVFPNEFCKNSQQGVSSTFKKPWIAIFGILMRIYILFVALELGSARPYVTAMPVVCMNLRAP